MIAFILICAAEVEKDIGDLIKSVPTLDDMFTVIDKIGSGNLSTIVIFILVFLAMIGCIRWYWCVMTLRVSLESWSSSLLWLPYGIGQAIIFLSCGFFFLSIFFGLFFLAYSQLSQIGCLPYFRTWCGLSVNLECRSETCCTWMAENTGCKKSPKIRHLRTIAQLCRALSSQLRHVSTIGKKLVKQQYLPHMSSQHGEHRPTSSWDWFIRLWQISTAFASWQHYCKAL